jgi:hypothetical protein
LVVEVVQIEMTVRVLHLVVPVEPVVPVVVDRQRMVHQVQQVDQTFLGKDTQAVMALVLVQHLMVGAEVVVAVPGQLEEMAMEILEETAVQVYNLQ